MSDKVATRQKRAPIACRKCRTRKIKCTPADNEPLSTCVNCAKNHIVCEYVPVQDEGASPRTSPSDYDNIADDKQLPPGPSSVNNIQPARRDQISTYNEPIMRPTLPYPAPGYVPTGFVGGTFDRQLFNPPNPYPDVPLQPTPLLHAPPPQGHPTIWNSSINRATYPTEHPYYPPNNNPSANHSQPEEYQAYNPYMLASQSHPTSDMSYPPTQTYPDQVDQQPPSWH